MIWGDQAQPRIVITAVTMYLVVGGGGRGSTNVRRRQSPKPTGCVPAESWLEASTVLSPAATFYVAIANSVEPHYGKLR